MDIELPFDFKEFLKLLNENGVRYLLIGGYAVGYHGYPRATNDMDVWIAIHPDNAQRVVNTLKEFGFDQPELTPELFLQKNKIIRMGHPPMRLEISTHWHIVPRARFVQPAKSPLRTISPCRLSSRQ
jgi:hypothetical protein